MGIVQIGSVSATIGTSGVIFAVTAQPSIDLRGRIHTFCHAVPGRWHVTGVTQAAGLSFRWFRDNFAAEESYDELVEEAAKISAGAEGVLWTPYLMGERTPHVDSLVRASLIGLTASHTKAHVVRALLEGVAFSLRDAIEIFKELNIPIETIRLGGGGARSPLWRQIQADVYGQPVQTVAAEEGAAYGAALIAGVGAGNWKTIDEACAETICISETIKPEAEAVKIFNHQYKAFQSVYSALSSVMKILNAKIH
jgi:xylulokinase